MTPEFERAVHRVVKDVTIARGGASDLVAVGVQRLDCLEFLRIMLKEEQVTGEWLAILVQWAVAIGVWLERARWEEVPS